MKKYNYLSVSGSILSTVLVFVFTLAPLGVFGAVTLGTNMSTTGTFAQTVGSASAALFQNAAGTVTTLSVDTTNVRVGVGAAASTTFEVQGTASASYFFTGNTIQVGGGIVASVAYNRFGSVATGHALSAINDVLINGKVEVDGTAFFDGKASISSNLQISGRFIADTAASNSFTGSLNVTKTLVVGSATASVSAGGSGYVAEFINQGTSTASFYFGGPANSTKGTCFQLKSTTGAWIYMRFNQAATTPTLSTTRCQ